MSSSRLSVLCVTKAEKHSFRFLGDMALLAFQLGAELVLVADGAIAAGRLHDTGFHARIVTSRGYIESVLDEALSHCTRDYVLRLDDDEGCSWAMLRWLEGHQYEGAPHWKFARANLWHTDDTFISNPPLFPDHQTRLSLRELSGGRSQIHAGSPHGGGELAPGMILHHKFLVKSLAERRAIVARYESIEPGAGKYFLPFSVPEDFYVSEQMELVRCREREAVAA